MKTSKLPGLIFIFLFWSLTGYIAKANSSPDWGNTGHRTIGEIAEKHLNKKAEKKIQTLLNGQNLAFISTFGDEIKSDKRYDKYYTWHYVNFPLDRQYEDSKKDSRGDIITGINYCIKILKNPNSSYEDQVFFLKFLVHLIGDLHQPLHIGRAEDRGGNDIKVYWHNKKSNLHRVWDSEMIDSWNMSYTELAKNTKTLSNEQLNRLQNGTVLDWMYDSRKLVKEVYKSVDNGDRIGYRYSYKNFSTAMDQLQKAGIRLAELLNQIYG